MEAPGKPLSNIGARVYVGVPGAKPLPIPKQSAAALARVREEEISKSETKVLRTEKPEPMLKTVTDVWIPDNSHGSASIGSITKAISNALQSSGDTSKVATPLDNARLIREKAQENFDKVKSKHYSDPERMKAETILARAEAKVKYSNLHEELDKEGPKQSESWREQQNDQIAYNLAMAMGKPIKTILALYYKSESSKAAYEASLMSEAFASKESGGRLQRIKNVVTDIIGKENLKNVKDGIRTKKKNIKARLAQATDSIAKNFSSYFKNDSSKGAVPADIANASYINKLPQTQDSFGEDIQISSQLGDLHDKIKEFQDEFEELYQTLEFGEPLDSGQLPLDNGSKAASASQSLEENEKQLSKEEHLANLRGARDELKSQVDLFQNYFGEIEDQRRALLNNINSKINEINELNNNKEMDPEVKKSEIKKRYKMMDTYVWIGTKILENEEKIKIINLVNNEIQQLEQGVLHDEIEALYENNPMPLPEHPETTVSNEPENPLKPQIDLSKLNIAPSVVRPPRGVPQRLSAKKTEPLTEPLDMGNIATDSGSKPVSRRSIQSIEDENVQQLSKEEQLASLTQKRDDILGDLKNNSEVKSLISQIIKALKQISSEGDPIGMYKRIEEGLREEFEEEFGLSQEKIGDLIKLEEQIEKLKV